MSYLKQIPPKNLLIIRGAADDFFCDQTAAQLAYQQGWRIREVAAGHDWNQNTAQAVQEEIKLYYQAATVL